MPVRHRSALAGYALLAGTALLNCTDPSAPRDEPELPDEQVPREEPSLVVSDATVSDAFASKAMSSTLRAASASNAADVVYVSIAPGTYPLAATVSIASPRSQSAVTAPVIDGGVDPVPIRASEGDTLQIALLHPDGAQVATMRAVVIPFRRPSVVRTIPPRKKVGVELNTNIVIVFSEPMDPRTLSSTTVRVELGGTAIAGTVQLLEGVTAAVIFRPLAPLQANADYQVRVTEGVRDLEGAALDREETIDFRTGTEVEGPIRSLALIPDGTDVRVGAQYQLVLEARDAEGRLLSPRPIHWSVEPFSDGPGIVSLSATGFVTAMKEGRTFILAEVEGLYVATLVTVSNTMVGSRTVTLSHDSMGVRVGGAVQLGVVTRDAAGNRINNRLVEWTSSDPGVATVARSANDSGVVTGIADGVARLIATVEGASDTAVVTVGPPPAIVGFAISPDTATLVLRQQTQLKGSSKDAAGGRNPLIASEVTWESSDPNVAAVDAGALVAARGPGEAIITGRWSNYTATARVSVVRLAFTMMDAGRWHTCGLASSNTTYCWGGSDLGQAGQPGIVDASPLVAPRVRIVAPAPVSGQVSTGMVSAGGAHNCALDADGRAWCWGYGADGELGNGATTNSSKPISVAYHTQYASIASGGSHTCALTASRTAYCWGSNRGGRLGDGTTTASARPVAVVGGETFTTITAGETQSCALTATGKAYCWGESSGGQLGAGGSISSSSKPIAVSGDLTFAAISAGASHTCGITTAGAAYCWGWNFDGQLGNGVPTTPTAVPSAVAGSHSFRDIAAASTYTCAVDTDGAAWCWGNGANGRLGTGSAASQNFPSPQRVAGSLMFTAITAGTAHTCGRATDSFWYCWGENAGGALGIGTTTPALQPAKVLGQP
jgi:alpha-tubulin suppressor-like RCC1 family protein